MPLTDIFHHFKGLASFRRLKGAFSTEHTWNTVSIVNNRLPGTRRGPVPAHSRAPDRAVLAAGWQFIPGRLADQTACKPGSVPLLGRSSGGRRSFLWTAHRCAVLATNPDLSGRRRPCSREREIPIRSCSRRGLPCRPCHQVRGGLLPHPFTLTGRPKAPGGLLSVALSLGSPPAGVTRRLVTVEPGLSSTSPRKAATARPSDPLR